MPAAKLFGPGGAVARHSRSTDAALVAACLAGDAHAWDALIERYEALIYSVPVRMGVADADAQDIFQDVCLLLFHHLEDLRDADRLSGWLITTARREVWRLGRRRGVTFASDLAEWQLDAAPSVTAPAPPAPGQAALALADQHLVRQGMAALAERCRALLTLLYCDEPPASYAEAARTLSVPLGSIGPQRARCLERLGKILKDLGF